MTETSLDYKNFSYPPGGILLWIIIFLELLTFGSALVVLVVYSKEDPAAYHQSRLMLNTAFGALNTLFLLTSGFFMAESVQQFNKEDFGKSSFYLLLTMIGGLLFLALKVVEYLGKIGDGLTFGYDTFFNFYWLLTGFHVIHVLVGMTILVFLYIGLKKKVQPTKREDFEAGAAFWHMCD